MRSRVFALVLFAVVATSCREGLLFRNDHRVTILSPKNNAAVAEPVSVRWSAREFVAGQDGQFAVFVDRDPMPPGEGIEYFAASNRAQGVFLLNETNLTIDVFTRRTGVDPAERDHHDVTVVLLDTSGRRIGESAGFVEFRIKR